MIKIKDYRRHFSSMVALLNKYCSWTRSFQKCVLNGKIEISLLFSTLNTNASLRNSKVYVHRFIIEMNAANLNI